MKRRSLLIVLFVLLISPAIDGRAHTEGKVDKTCPLCAEKFTCVLDFSGTQFGMRLDLKPLGPIAAPWRVPVCPVCHFVIYEDKIPEADLPKCKEIVGSEEYKKHSGRGSYFLVGLLFEGLNKEPLTAAQAFLQASWQGEGDKKLNQEDLERSLKHFESFLKQPAPDQPAAKEDGEKAAPDNRRQTAQLLKGELLRRLSRFDEATKHFDALTQIKEFQQGMLADIVKYQLRLCAAKDSAPHAAADAIQKKNDAAKEPVG